MSNVDPLPFSPADPLHVAGVRQTLVISTRPCRFDTSLEQLASMNVPPNSVQRWDGVLGARLFDAKTHRPVNDKVRALLSTNTQLAMQIGRVSSRDAHMPGSIGCSLSHIGVWKHVLRHNLDAVLVCEDDVQPTTNLPPHFDFRQAVASLVTEAGGTSAFDVLMIQHKQVVQADVTEAWLAPRAEGTVAPCAHLVRTFGDGWCTQCYVVTKRGAAALLRDALPISMAVDRYMYAMAATDRRFVMLRPVTAMLHHPTIQNGVMTSQIGGYSDISDLVLHVPKQVLTATLFAGALLLIYGIFAAIYLSIRSHVRTRRAQHSSIDHSETSLHANEQARSASSVVI